MRHTFLVLYSFLMVLLSSNTLFGQTIIGIGEVPVPGSLIQIKNIYNVNGGEANSDKGVLLPRVNLTDLNMLYPMFPSGYDKDVQDKIHAGLIVYNINVNLLNGKGAGVYVWDGNKWSAITGENENIDVSPDQLLLSEFNTEGSAQVTLAKKDQKWAMTFSGIEESSTMQDITNENGSTLKFTRSSTVFGNKIYTFKTIDNPNVQGQIEVSNLGLTINEPLIKVGVGKVKGAVTSSTVINVVGGDALWEVDSYSKDLYYWTVPPQNINGDLIFELGNIKPGVNQTPSGSVLGEIKVRHINEPRLIRTINIEQNKNY